MPVTRDRLLTATNELFRRHGFHGTSVKQITQAAHATTGSLYHFFPGGKDELAEAVITTSGAAYLDLFRLIADSAGSAPQAITDFFEGAAEVLVTTDYVEICPIGTVARETASTHDALRNASQTVFTTWVVAATDLLTDGGLASTEAGELAFALVAALEGGFLLARTARSPEPLRAVGRQMRLLVDASLTAQDTATNGSDTGRRTTAPGAQVVAS